MIKNTVLRARHHNFYDSPNSWEIIQRPQKAFHRVPFAMARKPGEEEFHRPIIGLVKQEEKNGEENGKEFFREPHSNQGVKTGVQQERPFLCQKLDENKLPITKNLWIWKKKKKIRLFFFFFFFFFLRQMRLVLEQMFDFSSFSEFWTKWDLEKLNVIIGSLLCEACGNIILFIANVISDTKGVYLF